METAEAVQAVEGGRAAPTAVLRQAAGRGRTVTAMTTTPTTSFCPCSVASRSCSLPPTTPSLHRSLLNDERYKYISSTISCRVAVLFSSVRFISFHQLAKLLLFLQLGLLAIAQ